MKFDEKANELVSAYGEACRLFALFVPHYLRDMQRAENALVGFISALEAEIAELRDVIGDYRNDASRVLDEKCPSDERHCGCVPILRDQLNKYQKALILITTMPELSQATTIAREALQERGKFIWTEQSVGEYWVTKLDILQDKFDTLEKDYADVCQKRLEAADVFSRQIIELEAENAELRALRDGYDPGERLPGGQDGR